MDNDTHRVQKTIRPLVDGKMPTRIKLSGLWVATALCYIEGDFTTFFPPGGYIQQSLAGRMGPFRTSQLTLLGGSVFVSIPCVLVFLSLVLPSAWCRRVNIVFGILYTVINALSAFTTTWAYFVYFGVVESVLTVLVVWYSWKWAREPSISPLI
jgi:Family of unknown function (DUF6326)